MHPRSALSRPSPKRSISCAGLDDLEDLFHGTDSVRTHPNRKRHHSLNNDNNSAATNFATSSSPSRHDYSPPPASYPGALRRPELPPFSEKNSSCGGFHLAPSVPSTFESRYGQASSNQVQHKGATNSDEQDNNYEEEHCHDFNNEFNRDDASYGGCHEYKNIGDFSTINLASQDPQSARGQYKQKHDLGVFALKRLDHNVFLPPSLRLVGSECSPREEFLVQAFGPTGFKLHGASSSSSKDELEDCFSDDSSNNNNMEHSSPSQDHAIADADTELKMSFNELEADLRGAMHQNLHQQQHSARLPELAGLSHQAFASSPHGLFRLDRSANYPRNNQDMHRATVFGQSQSVHPHLVQNQKETGYFPGEQQHQSPSRSSMEKTAQNKGSGGVQTPTKWLRDEDERLRVAVARFGGKNWKMIAETLGNGRTDVQCLHRWNKVLKPGLIKGPWTPEEDRILTSLITRYGVGKIRWCDLALHLPGRIGKQCRERWCNHLDSRIRKGQWTPEEDDMVFRWQQKLGNKWSEIAKLLPGRTENAVKNRFNSAARRKWVMNQTNKTLSTSETSSAQSQSRGSPHMLLQQQSVVLHPSSSAHQGSHVYNSDIISYGSSGKVTPLPRSAQAALAASMEDHHKMVPPLVRQSYIQHYTPPGTQTTESLLSSGVGRSQSVFRPALATVGEQCFQQDHDKHLEAGKSESMLLVPSPTFVPPPLNSLFHPPPVNATGVAGRSFHNLPSIPTNVDAVTMAGFPFTAHLPTLLQHEESTLEGATKSESADGGDFKDADLPLLQLKEEKPERADLVPTIVSEQSAAPDASVAMDDENMNSFLDSVALELDDIME